MKTEHSIDFNEIMYGEFSGKAAPDRSHLYRAGMSEKEWFDVALKCGELEQFYDSWGSRSATIFQPHCGASDWRVIRFNLMAPWERSLQCNKCKLWTLVTMPAWKRGAAVEKEGERGSR
jgi:hypothetical protein